MGMKLTAFVGARGKKYLLCWLVFYTFGSPPPVFVWMTRVWIFRESGNSGPTPAPLMLLLGWGMGPPPLIRVFSWSCGFHQIIQGKEAAKRSQKNCLKQIVSGHLISFEDVSNLQVPSNEPFIAVVFFLHTLILWKHVGPFSLPPVSYQAENYKDVLSLKNKEIVWKSSTSKWFTAGSSHETIQMKIKTTHLTDGFPAF